MPAKGLETCCSGAEGSGLRPLTQSDAGMNHKDLYLSHSSMSSNAGLVKRGDHDGYDYAIAEQKIRN